MKSFLDYLGKVEADDQLKENTKAYIEAALADRGSQQGSVTPVMNFRKKSVARKKMFLALSSIAACAVFTFGGYMYYNTPVNYVSLDINPSIELGINAFDRVVSVEDYNEDGTLLLKANEYTHQTLEHAIQALIQEAAKQGFIKDSGSTVIAATIGSENEKNAIALQDICADEIDLALRAEEKSAVIYTDWIDLQERTKAREAGMSPGKYRMIKILESLDPGVTIEQFRNARITDLITTAGEMLQGVESGPKSEFTETIERMGIAAQQVQAAHREAEQEKNLNQDSVNGSQNTQNESSNSAEQEQVQNLNQNLNQNQNLSQNPNSETTVPQQEQKQEQEQEQEKNQNQTSDSSDSSGESGLQTESGKAESPSSNGGDPSGVQSGSGSGGKN